MRTRFTAAPGVSLPAIGLQTGYTHGIEIDNPSGSWLYVPSLETFCPPYTLGWSYTFPLAVSSVDIIAGDGPSGQVGTIQGDPIIVYLTSYAVATSPGSPDPGAAFLVGFTPAIIVESLIVAAFSVPTQTNVGFLPAVAGKRYRFRYIEFSLDEPPTMPNPVILTPIEGACLVRLSENLGGNIASALVTTITPTVTLSFPQGRDAAVGRAINFAALPAWPIDPTFGGVVSVRGSAELI